MDIHTNQEGKYELHITLSSHQELPGWKPSAIDGDPLLGSGVKHYLTSYASDERAALDKLATAVGDLRDMGLDGDLLRAKIEHIVYDVRFDG